MIIYIAFNYEKLTVAEVSGHKKGPVNYLSPFYKCIWKPLVREAAGNTYQDMTGSNIGLFIVRIT